MLEQLILSRIIRPTIVSYLGINPGFGMRLVRLVDSFGTIVQHEIFTEDIILLKLFDVQC